MGSDRAQGTFERTKQYRRVVAQQGRVELEADKNEAAEIATEALRLETIDVVGPFGVPFDPMTNVKGTGYQIAAAGPIILLATGGSTAPPDFQILPGPLYLGGWRVEQEVSGLTFSGQANGDWLPNPISEDATSGQAGNLESIVLHLAEHEVSAVEDRTLREVALGGPDTAQRLRLTRHVRRFTVSQRTCASAFAQVVKEFAQRGFDFDPRTMALTSTLTLQVTPDPTPPQASPCDPVARGGYLGAENQMIRVAIANPGRGAPNLLWAYDNASDLYVASVDSARPRRVVLGAAPVDTFHWPKSQQFVEVVRAGVKLGDDGYAAAESGRVFRLAQDYDPDTGSVTLDADLDAEFFAAAALFLRVWQNEQAFTPGTPTELVDKVGTAIGLAVTVNGALPTFQYHVGEAWCFAARPGFPESVFPARYEKSAQPPEAPRQWLAPLACIEWSEQGPIISDCRPGFEDLVQLTADVEGFEAGGCCTVRVKPSDAANLQAIIDRFKGRAATICLAPGSYVLPKPLRLTAEHSGITLEGGEGKAVIAADESALSEFAQGLIELTQVSDVTLRKLDLQLSAVKFGARSGASAGTGLLDAALSATSAFSVAFGVRSINSTLRIEHCSFQFSARDDGNIVGAAVFLGGKSELDVDDSTFSGTPGSLSGTSTFVGILATPAVTLDVSNATLRSGASVPARLANVRVERSRFDSLRAAALLVGTFGRLRFADNRVSRGYAGFLVTAAEAWGSLKDLSALAPKQAALAVALLGIDSDRFLRLAYAVGSVYPLPSGASGAGRLDLPAVAAGSTFESVAASAASSLRDALLASVALSPSAGLADERSLRTSNEAPDLALDVLASRNAILLPVDVRVLSQPLDVIGWNLGLLAGDTDAQATQGSSIQIENNDIDLGASGVASRYAVAVFDSTSTVVMNGNRATSMYSLIPTVMIVAKRSAVTGNVASNYASGLASRPERASFLDHSSQLLLDVNLSGHLPAAVALIRYSLAVFPHANAGTASTVVTGNLCEGALLVPERPAAAGPSWQQLNTEVP